MRRSEIDKCIAEMRRLAKQITVNSIAEHFDENVLFNWCGALRQDFTDVIDELEGLIDER